MAQLTPLTRGCLARLNANNYRGAEPVLQVIELRRFQNANEFATYRICLSDGRYIQTIAMITAALNARAENGELNANTIIRVTRHDTLPPPAGQRMRILIVSDFERLHTAHEVGRQIGRPIPLARANNNNNNINILRARQLARLAELNNRVDELELQNRQQRAQIDDKDGRIAVQDVTIVMLTARINELIVKIADHGDKIDRLESTVLEMKKNSERSMEMEGE